nr:JDVT-CTERM system glutamic-type intramembrane protease [Endozoicomonas sp. G2_2]
MAVGVLPLLEEIVFRLGVHDALATRLPGRVGALTRANLLTAACFALAHLLQHPPGWALATFVPALVYGALWERHRRLFVPVSVHAFYNLAYLCLLGAPPGVS